MGPASRQAETEQEGHSIIYSAADKKAKSEFVEQHYQGRNMNNNNSENQKKRKRNKNLKYLQVLYTNADCLMNKRLELMERITSEKPHIIVVTEVNPKNQQFVTTKQELDVSGYTTFTNACEKGKRGVLILMKNHLNATEAPIPQDATCEEVVAAEFSLKGGDRQLVMGVYRSPNSSADNNIKLNSMIRNAEQWGYSHILILGDFNHPEITWDDGGEVTRNCQTATDFLDAVNDAYLHQHVEILTRHRVDQVSNTLDLVFTNEESMIEEVQEHAPLGKSDHITLKLKVRCYADIEEIIKIRQLYEKADFTAMGQFMSCDWDDLLGDKNTEEKWGVFLDKLNQAIELYIPKKKSIQSEFPRPKWLNQGTMRSVRKKHKAFMKWRELKSSENYLAYAKTRNQTRWATRKAVKQYEKAIASNVKTNPKLFWNYVNSKLKSRQPISDLKKDNGELTVNDVEKAQVLNTFFASVFTDEDLTNIPDPGNHSNSILDNIDISEDDIRKRLLKLNISKSPGPDGLHPRVLKELANTIARPLMRIFQTSLTEGKLPSDWRIAHVTPIYKKGPKTDAGNYRPVSLTSILGKLMEGIIRDGVVSHLKENDCFSPHQHGFMNGRSTITQLLETLEYWSKSLDNGAAIDAIYLDFQKAFDSVPHQRLLRKIRSYGITGQVYNWIEAFLLDRKQKVIVNGAESDWASVKSGIPQGSVLGPILFIIFINDMPNETICPIKLFADDAKLFQSVETVEQCEQIQRDLDSLQHWANKWQLRFHPKKCTVLRVGRNHPDYDYYMLDGSVRVKLGKSECEKDLGVHVDKLLKFDHHISTIVKKGNQMSGLMWRTFEYIDEGMFLTLYKTMVRSHLEYAAPIWSPHTWNLTEELEKVQRRATKRVPSLAGLSYEERLKKLKLPTLVYRRLRGDLINVFKYVNGVYDTATSPLMLDGGNRTRGHSKKLKVMYSRTDQRHFFFTQRVTAWWNELPEEVVEAPSVNAFKSRFDAHFKNHPVVYDYRALDNPAAPRMTVT